MRTSGVHRSTPSIVAVQRIVVHCMLSVVHVPGYTDDSRQLFGYSR